MIIDITQTNVEQHRDCCGCPKCLHDLYNPPKKSDSIPIRDNTRSTHHAIRIGFIETPLEECTWVRWENCPTNVKDLIDGWHGLWMSIPTRDLAAKEKRDDN